MDKKEKTIRIDGKDIVLHPEHPVRFACMEHADTQIDEYVDEFEAAPDTYRAASVEDETLDKRCRECGAPADIALLREKGM
ncbi:CxxH/CxxC protein [Brevibacillus ruminantium]|uniref:CxxH/CxxC protein n=1 Tax=Brevibacillus ruminantium TaxID=2950604 RepID=A0ABY4WGC7_9BACL|nr:CxxH/CxxC protein [Brevibacillus ruminantium]USG65759.1 CxxH/CxxC protein [Brevibacillus ruminantium]